MMEEKNSEGKFAKVMIIICLVVAALGAASAALVEGGLVAYWPAFATVSVVLGYASKLAWSYIQSRPPKHASMAQEVVAQAQLIAAQAMSTAKNPPSP
jgi:hypothetical protein